MTEYTAFQLLLIILVMMFGFATIIGGPAMAGKLSKWLFKTAFKLIGKGISALGTLIQSFGK